MTNITHTQSTIAQLASAVNENQMQLSEKIGALKATAFIKKLVTVTEIKMLAELKETKEYKGLQVFDPDGKLVTVTSWEDFCKAIGQSREHLDENIRNLSTFGEDFLETSQRMGLGYRDLRKLRKLPEDEQQVIINGEAVKAEDKESLIDLIEEMSVKHAKDKEALQNQAKALEKTIKDLESEARAKDAVLANKDKKINELDGKLTVRKQPDQFKQVQIEVEQHINDELAQASASVLTAISQFNAKVELLTSQAGENFLPHLKDKIQQDISVVYNRIAQVGFEVGVDLEIMMKPDWLDTDSQPADIPDFELSTYTEADLDK
ncbi:conserved hypothetical protein [Enhydrobacter sp. 8BJ]|nr:hypothetical protein [Enhydrobacter sp. 8BJ]VXB85859.1 conserved hypothetical protein [Enhydrobacter sp. 8BJ]